MTFSLSEFPLSRNFPFIITSPETSSYNCIAWAYGISDKRMWPNSRYYWWPPGVSNKLDLNSFEELFKSIGYENCADDSFENGYLKIAIYTKKNGEPTHAARQLPDGNWTSKLGDSYDVQHTIEGMSNGYYENATSFMRRPI